MAATRNISTLLTAASSALLANQAQGQNFDQSFENDWKIDFGTLIYEETDRVAVDKYVTNINGRLSDNDTIDVKLILDSMSGATPTGEIGGDGSYTSTGTSGGTATTSGGSAGQQSFSDTRFASEFIWSRNHSRTFRANYGAYTSVESDYTAFGSSVSVEKDNADRSMTWNIGVSGTSDTLSAAGGGTPEPLAETTSAETYGEGDRSTVDIVGGLTRVINPRTLMQFAVGISNSRGYLTDPYKLISFTFEGGVDPTPIYEKRPGERTRNHLYWKVLHHDRRNNTLQFATRFYQDDWGISSTMFEYRHRFNQITGNYIEPSLQLYQQSAADFYVYSLELGEALPEFASADARLAELTSTTLGVKYGLRLNDASEVGFRFQYYLQDIENNFITENEATMININYSAEFD